MGYMNDFDNFGSFGGGHSDGLGGFFSEFGFFSIVFCAVFLLVFAIVIVAIVKNIAQWNKNNKAPRLIVEATVVSKREDVRTHHSTEMHHAMHDTWYYVTFQVESGDRMELSVTGRDYGMMAEGDTGKLTFQGTRFLEFDRMY